jgi:hypothetical protein
MITNFSNEALKVPKAEDILEAIVDKKQAASLILTNPTVARKIRRSFRSC